jgi:putative hydrolase of the HAD superfamily
MAGSCHHRPSTANTDFLGADVTDHNGNRIEAVLFDFGGVLAEEGFREGLMAIARANDLDPEAFFKLAAEQAYETGYVVGTARESTYWNAVRNLTGIRGTDEEFRRELLVRFLPRPWVMKLVRAIRASGRTVAILSDQTDWLEELDKLHGFYREFHMVFNSYRLGKGKRDPSLFTDVARKLGIRPEHGLFIDDNEGHVERARSRGFNAILFRDREQLLRSLARFGVEIGSGSSIGNERLP